MAAVMMVVVNLVLSLKKCMKFADTLIYRRGMNGWGKKHSANLSIAMGLNLSHYNIILNSGVIHSRQM